MSTHFSPTQSSLTQASRTQDSRSFAAGSLRLILLVSCAHALVHVYELALPSVEQAIAKDLSVEKNVMGLLANSWRLPFGFGALLAGWLVDRFGSARMLALYLCGCGLMCLASGAADSMPVLFLTMFSMGSFAAIYHPAGLALISHETNPENRARALGIHGVFGSAGIAAAPFVAAAALFFGLQWESYYWLLAAPGLALGLFFALKRRRAPKTTVIKPTASMSAAEEHSNWPCFVILTVFATLQGFMYAAVLSFLPRYLDGWSIHDVTINGWRLDFLESVASSRFITSAVLAVGCGGQFLAGWFARPNKLERQLTIVMLLNIPCLIGMALATEGSMAAAAGLWSFVHFMLQPLYNSLIAKYTPPHRRSLCYGFSFTMAFGVGSVGASFAGWIPTFHQTYLLLAAVAAMAAASAALLWWLNRDANAKPSP